MDSLRVIEFATYNKDSLTLLTAVFVLFAGLMIMALPRRYAIVPLLAVACFIHYQERVVIGGMDFDMRRLMLIFAMVRVTFRREVTLEVNRLDKLVICWAAAMSLVPVILSPSQLVWGMGSVLDNVIGYIVIKAILHDVRSIEIAASWLALFSVPICFGMLWEVTELSNPFHIFGASEGVVERDGEIRASAGFDHPILAGTFGGVVFPFVFILWSRGGWRRLLALVAVLTSFIIVYASKSSGPLYGFMGGVFAVALWKVRRQITRIRNGLWITLVIAQLFMNAPVYAIIFRIPDALGLVTGSTSYHRFMVIDAAIKNVSQWWLIGTSSDVVGTWGYGAQDVTNHFIAIGFASGLFGIVLFVMVLVRAFSMTGHCVRSPFADMSTKKCAWALGSLLFMHVISFLGVAYFSGFSFFLLMSFAMISCHCGAYVTSKRPAEAHKVSPLQAAHDLPGN
jgi:hypothetical protein